MTAAGWVGRGTGRVGIVTVALVGLVTAACGSSGTKAGGTNGAAGMANQAGSRSCPSKPMAFAAPSPWEAIGQKPSSGATSPEPIFESRLTVSNPNPVDLTVQAKAAVTTDRSIFDYGGNKASTSSGLQIVTFGEPSPAGGNRIDGKDIRLQTVTPIVVAARGSIDLIARASTIVYATPITTKAVYGKGLLAGNSAEEINRCEIAVDGAEPLKLLGGA